MSINLNLETIQELVLPSKENDPLVHAIYTRQYNRTLVRLHQLHQRIQTETPQLAQDSGFSYAIEVLSTFPSSIQKKILHYPAASFWLDVAWDLVHRHAHIRFPQMHIYQHL